MKEKWIHLLALISSIITIIGILLIFFSFTEIFPIAWSVGGVVITAAGVICGCLIYQKEEQLEIKKALRKKKDPL